MARVFAPWTAEQVCSLNEYQRCDYVHPFTGVDSDEALVASEQGWHVADGGPVVQNWAHDFMADWSWRRLVAAIERLGG